jgi:hypothetical protein
MRSCSLSILMGEPAEQVASMNAVVLIPADELYTGGQVRWSPPRRPMRPMPVAGSARGAVLAFQRARFPGPPSEPACRSSRHRALHQARHQQTVVLPLGSAVPGLDCQVGRRYSPAAAALPTRHRSLAVPFAMCTPLACADYYGHSATTRPNSRRRTCPPPKGGEGSDLVAAHVHHHPVDEVGVQLYPAASPGVRRRPSPWPPRPATTCRLRSRSPPSRRACTADRPRSARLEPARRLRLGARLSGHR